MKVVAFNGSPRKRGNTYHAIQTVFKVLKKEGIKTELIQLGAQILNPAGHALNALKIKIIAVCRTIN